MSLRPIQSSAECYICLEPGNEDRPLLGHDITHGAHEDCALLWINQRLSQDLLAQCAQCRTQLIDVNGELIPLPKPDSDSDESYRSNLASDQDNDDHEGRSLISSPQPVAGPQYHRESILEQLRSSYPATEDFRSTYPYLPTLETLEAIREELDRMPPIWSLDPISSPRRAIPETNEDAASIHSNETHASDLEASFRT